MNFKGKMREKSGITLISLVVTIIVLLILAGVTIATLTGNNGILTKASEASERTEIAEVKEMAQTDILSNQTENKGDISKENFVEILNKYFDNVPTVDKLPKDLSTLTLTTKKEYGSHDINISEIYNGTFDMTVENLKAGDKVNYIDKNGNTIECIVLYDSNSEYGVQIIASDIVDTVTLGSSDFNIAMDSYNNAITALNIKAEEYLNTSYVSDARCVGSVPNNKNAESGIFTSEYDYMSLYTFKDADTNYEADYNQMEVLDITTASSNYWLSSRYTASGSYNSNFYVRFVNASGHLSNNNDLCYVNTYGSTRGKSYSYGFRPVFTLKSRIKVTKGDGDATPYTLEL